MGIKTEQKTIFVREVNAKKVHNLFTPPVTVKEYRPVTRIIRPARVRVV